MPKINPATLERKPGPVFSETFTDPDQPGVEVELRIRKVMDGSVLDLWAQGRMAELVEQYITGKVDAKGNPLLDKEKKPVQPPQGFPMLDGPWLPVGHLNRLSIALACKFAALEKAGDKPEEDRYNEEDFIRLAETMPTAWRNMILWANGVTGDGSTAAEGSDEKGGDPPREDPGEPEKSSPELASTTGNHSPTS